MFSKLRGALRENDINQAYLAEKLGLCSMSVSNRFTGKTPWRLDEMYFAMDLIGAPHEQLHLYFPKSGKRVPL